MDLYKFVLFCHSFYMWFVVAVRAICDEVAINTCITQYDRSLQSQDPSQLTTLCASKRVVQDLGDCLSRSTEDCSAATIDTFTSQVANLTLQIQYACDNMYTFPDTDSCSYKFRSECAHSFELAKIYGSLVNGDGNMASQTQTQHDICRQLHEIDFAQIKVCLDDNGCATESAFSNIPRAPNLPIITYMDIVNIVEGICQPGCANFSIKYKAAKQCTQKGKSERTNCRAVSELFECMRQHIGSCDVLRDFLEKALDNSHLSDEWKAKCKDINMSLAQTDNPENTASSIGGMLHLSFLFLIHLFL